jgi:hypothetical protein
MTINLAAVLFFVAMVLAFVALFVDAPRWRLLCAALGFTAAGLLCLATGLG